MGKSKPKKKYDKKFEPKENTAHNVSREGITPSNNN